MAMKLTVRAHLDTLISRYPVLDSIQGDITAAFDTMRQCYEWGGKLLLAGNGGSCADAEHIVGELMKGFILPRRLPDEFAARLAAADPNRGQALAAGLQQGLPAIALSAHSALNTAFMNDADPTMVYAQQLNALGNPGDVFFAISTSGNAQNIYDACIVAKAKGMKIVALTGKTGGKLKDIADVSMIMPCNETYQIQELHLPIYHCLCLMLEEQFFGQQQ